MSITCPNCQQINPAQAMFCHHCGAPVGSGQPATGPVPGHPAMAMPGAFIGKPTADIGGPGTTNMGGVPTSGPTSGSRMQAIGAVILAALSLLCFGFLTGIPAAILGWLELTAIKEGRSSESNRWMAHVGLWGGLAFSLLHLGLTLLMLMFWMMAAAEGTYNGGYGYEYGHGYGY